MAVVLQGHELAIDMHSGHGIALSTESEVEMSKAENAHMDEIGTGCFSPSLGSR